VRIIEETLDNEPEEDLESDQELTITQTLGQTVSNMQSTLVEPECLPSVNKFNSQNKEPMPNFASQNQLKKASES
jgi:hypothetical protein